MSYVYMKVLETAPERYERGMRLLTLGRLQRVYRDVAASLSAGDRVLDIGCGPGELAVLLARGGCQVTGIDVSPQMLRQASHRVQAAGVAGLVTLREVGAVELDTAFPAASFDALVSTLVFSELSSDEMVYTLSECRRVLKREGLLLVADEVLPASFLGRVATFLFRLPFVLLAYLLTQNTTRRVSGLRQRIEGAGFRVLAVHNYLAGTLQLLQAQRVEP
jgi:demethylmenaquinone methyltransferase/2-methoxy-6-polyprenyl-1,4-benzoquinol methylase